MTDREMTMEEMAALYKTWDFDRLFDTYSAGIHWHGKYGLSEYEWTQLMVMRQQLREWVFAFREVL